MSIGVVIPAKPLDRALSRLGAILEPAARRALQAAMLTDVVDAALAVAADVVVVSGDRSVYDLAAGQGARVVADADPPAGINAAVTRGLDALDSAAALVVMGDLPMATPADLQQVVSAAPVGRAVVAAVSADGTGTNAMLLRPVGFIAPAFGIGSLARHMAAAAGRGIECTLVTAPGLMLDIDTPEDLAALVRSGRDCHTTRLLAAFGVGDPVGAGGA